MAATLTERDAYAAMFAFLEELYRRTASDELGALLGGMSLLQDGGTADPAIWADWEDAVRKAKAGTVQLELTLSKDG